MDNFTKKANIIDTHTLQQLLSIENKTLSEVICYLWVNQIHPKETIDLIDAVQLIFADGTQITLSSNDTQEGLMSIEYNFEEQKKLLEKEFQGKLKIFKVLANHTAMWKDVINTKLLQVRLTRDKDTQQYLCDEIVLEFENNQYRLIQVHPIDGIILDYYEEI